MLLYTVLSSISVASPATARPGQVNLENLDLARRIVGQGA